MLKILIKQFFASDAISNSSKCPRTGTRMNITLLKTVSPTTVYATLAGFRNLAKKFEN